MESFSHGAEIDAEATGAGEQQGEEDGEEARFSATWWTSRDCPFRAIKEATEKLMTSTRAAKRVNNPSTTRPAQKTSAKMQSTRDQRWPICAGSYAEGILVLAEMGDLVHSVDQQEEQAKGMRRRARMAILKAPSEY